jgi:SAM-dependent methyltransferase
MFQAIRVKRSFEMGKILGFSSIERKIFNRSFHFSTIERVIQQELEEKYGSKTLKVLQHDYQLLHKRLAVREEPLNLKHKIIDVKGKECGKSQLFFYGERETSVYLATEFGFNLEILIRVLGELAGKGNLNGNDENFQSEEGQNECEEANEEKENNFANACKYSEAQQFTEANDFLPVDSIAGKKSNSTHSRYSKLASLPLVPAFESPPIHREWQPKSILDFGCGPACGFFAARAVWPDLESFSYTGIDISQEMLDAGNRLIEVIASSSASKQHIALRRFNSLSKSDVHDLVICSFALLEISRDEQLLKQTLHQLWKQTSKYMVIVSKADREGWDLTQKAKELIGTLDSQARVVAPCGSSALNQCSSDCACFFRERMNISKLTRNVLNTKKTFTFKFFSYLIFEKQETSAKSTPNAPRIVGIPKKMTKCVEFKLCTGTDKIVNASVSQADGKQVYKAVRKINWGDRWLHQYRLQVNKEKEDSSRVDCIQ